MQGWEHIAKAYLHRFGDETDSAIPILQAIQTEQGYLPRPLLDSIGVQAKNIQLNQLYGVATFYSQFSFVQTGKNCIKACQGTACHIKGADRVLVALKDKLGIDVDETTGNGSFSLKTVSCLGCCSLAPVLMANDQIFGSLTPIAIPKIIEGLTCIKERR